MVGRFGRSSGAPRASQINLRLPTELDLWIEEQAGGKRDKPAFIRQVLERERARARERALQAIFDQAWSGLSEEERQSVRLERAEWLGAYADRGRP